MKTKALFLFVYLFAIHSIFSQDYTCIKPLDTVYFKTKVSYQYVGFVDELLPIKLDSITTQNDTIFLHNYKMIRNRKANSDPWTGKDILVLPNSYNMFINKDSDTLKIKTNAILNEVWHFYTFQNENYIEADVTSVESETFFGITDDIKTIQLQVKNSVGGNISSPINDMYLKLSKNYGLVRCFNFYDFPDSNEEYPIVGFNSLGISDFTAADIYNFDIGDELRKSYSHYKYQEYDWRSTTMKKIIDKETNSNELIYEVDGCYSSYYDGTHYQGQSQYTWEIDLNSPEKLELNAISNIPYHIVESNGDHHYFIFGSDGISKWKKYEYYGSDLTNLSEFYPNPDGSFYDYRVFYLKGLGGNYYDFNYSMCRHDYNKLVYYKKGTTVFGTPYSCSALLEVDKIKDNVQLYIFPNPVNNNLHISLNNENSFKQYSILITDVTGKKHLEQTKNTNEFTIDTSKLIDGMYILQLVSDKGVITRKFMVRH